MPTVTINTKPIQFSVPTATRDYAMNFEEQCTSVIGTAHTTRLYCELPRNHTRVHKCGDQKWNTSFQMAPWPCKNCGKAHCSDVDNIDCHGFDPWKFTIGENVRPTVPGKLHEELGRVVKLGKEVSGIPESQAVTVVFFDNRFSGEYTFNESNLRKAD